MMQSDPDFYPVKISVVMCVLNGEKYLAQSVDSILSQTYTDFEFIIVDDGSTDSTPEILRAYERQDPRIKILTNSVNKGIGYSRNRGIAETRGEYIANMDADDWCLPERFARQLSFLEKRPEIAVLGTACIMVDEISKRQNRWENPDLPGRVRWALLFNCPVMNSSAMIRKSRLPQSFQVYKQEFSPAEDYELWARIAETDKIANLSESLCYYRWHENNISVTSHLDQSLATYKIIQAQVHKYTNLVLPQKLISMYRKPQKSTDVYDFQQVARVYRLLVQSTSHWRLNLGEKIDVYLSTCKKLFDGWRAVGYNQKLLGEITFAVGLLVLALLITPIWKLRLWLTNGECAWQ